MVDCVSRGKDWIDVFSALLTPTIAVFAILITLLQWRTNRSRLKHELFDRRYEVFEKIQKFIPSISASDSASDEVQNEKTTQFLADTKSVRFLFDKKTADYTDEVYKKAVVLCTLREMFGGGTEENRETNLQKQLEIKAWYSDQLHNLDNRFRKYLKLGH